MYALFLESRAADEVRSYIEHHPAMDLEELLARTYSRNKEGFLTKDWGPPNKGPYSEEEEKRFNDYWVGMCLDDDSHKEMDIDSLFCWGDTEEGHEFWSAVSRRDEDDGPW
jgi:hypothetical protein